MKKFFAFALIILSYGFAFGAERLFYEGFESASLANVTKSGGVTINNNEAFSGKYCARVQFGPDEGNQLIAKKLTSGINNEIYVKYYIKLDPLNWPGDESFKPFRAFHNYKNSPGLELWSGGCGRNISGHINTGDGKYQYTYYTDFTAYNAKIAPSWKGSWTKIEVYLKKNSAVGVSDGVYKLWWNGVLIYNNTSVQHLNSNNEFYDTFYFPSNMNCDLGRLSACCGWDGATPFYAYIDDVEIWNGFPSNYGTDVSNVSPPSGLKVK